MILITLRSLFDLYGDVGVEFPDLVFEEFQISAESAGAAHGDFDFGFGESYKQYFGEVYHLLTG